MGAPEDPEQSAPLDVSGEPEAARDSDGWAGGHTTHSIEEDLPSHALLKGFSLTVRHGADAPAKFESKGERAVVGTHEAADLVLHDPTVSRFHCEISVSDGKVTLRDLESTNGTTVNGVSVLHAHLEPGATIGIGRTELGFELAPSEVKLPLSPRDLFGIMVGRSTAMRRVFAVLERVAASDATVLLQGETGTGKEAAAESIHRESGRRDGPFVVVDCAAIPPDLLESELFGHERGAFTGATSARSGVFETAQGGTLFLDEVGELDLELQPKLLRALERREIRRVGGSKYVPIDVRIVAATNRSLRAEVNQRKFRSDLYYRLAVVEVVLPALRERADDLPLLVNEILLRLGASAHPEAPKLRSRGFLADLARHAWPGNVRELRNYVERYLALGETAPLDSEASEAPESMPLDLPLKVARERWNRTFERRYVEQALQRHDNNVAAAARAAGVDRMYFYRLLWRYGLR